MLSLQLTQLTVSLIIAATSFLLVFLSRTWISSVGVATVIGLATYFGFRTIDILSLLYSDVIRAVTAKIFPFIRRKVKSYSHSVDKSAGYELDKELAELLNCIVRHCIESWYSHISECQSPVTDARLLIIDVTKLLLGRLASIDCHRFLRRILCLYREHLNSCGYDETKHHSLTYFMHHKSISLPISAAYPDSEQTADVCLSDTVQYLNSIALTITGKLLDKHSANCALGKEILSQIIVKEVILRILDIASDPEWLFNIISDILSDDSSIGSFDSLRDHFCTYMSAEDIDKIDLPAENNAEDQNSSTTSCSNGVNYDVPSAAAVDSILSFAVSGNATSTKDTSVCEVEQLEDLKDAGLVLCSDEDYLVLAYSDANEQSHSESSEVKTDNVAASVDNHEISSHVSSSDSSRDKKHIHSRSRSDCSLTFERKSLEMPVVANGPNRQLDNATNISPELSSSKTTTSNPQSSFQKKRSSLVRMLPSFKRQGDKAKAVDSRSMYSAVYEVSKGVEVKEDSDSETGCSTAGSRIFISHKKTNSFGSSEEAAYVKPHISHSASVNALIPESESDVSAGFLSRHLSHFVRRFSSGLVRIPLFRSGSSDLLFDDTNSTSDIEFEDISDLEVSAIEAAEDFLIDYQPDFLFKNIRISLPERDVPVSKSYAVYVISVSNILSR